MHRRSLLRAIVAFPAVAGAALLPNIARAESRLIPLEDIYGPMRVQFTEWRIADQMKGHPASFDPIFSEEEMRAYVEMSIDWMNARMEGDPTVEFLPGDPEQVVDDAIYTHLEGETREVWKSCVQWMAITHAMFSLAINFVHGEDHGVRMVVSDPNPVFQKFKEVAEAEHDAAWDVLMETARKQYG